MAFPSPPWSMRGQVWLSVFHARRPGTPASLHGVGFVSYEPGSTLTYAELAVGHRVQVGGTRRLHVTDMWVDSEESLEGGRGLWGMPKQSAEFSHDSGGLGPVGRSAWSATAEGLDIATASFADVSRLVPRFPFSGSTWQVRDDGSEALGHLRGSGRALPCLAHWEFDADGPLAWLHGKQPLSSFRIRDFTMSLD